MISFYDGAYAGRDGYSPVVVMDNVSGTAYAGPNAMPWVKGSLAFITCLRCGASLVAYSSTQYIDPVVLHDDYFHFEEALP